MAKKAKKAKKAKTVTARAVEPRPDTDTYTSGELCARYGCAQVTIRRKEAEEGFPVGRKFGRKLIYGKRAVHDWERKHMPGLHTESERELTEEDKKWDRMRRQHALDKEMSAAEPGTEKARRRGGR